MIADPKICYICGNPLSKKKQENGDDHVPPKQFYSKEIRSSKGFPHLFTLPTHKKCNEAYSSDEQYFTHALLPIAVDSYTGRSLWNEIGRQYNEGKNIPLLKKSFAEISQRPSGLYLPGYDVVKYFDPQRVWRVIWKIHRGLFFYHYGTFLPEETPRGFDITSPNHNPPRTFDLVRSEPGHGVYSSVFDYKFKAFDLPKEPKRFHVWAMLFWDEIITLTGFHDPSCACEVCKKERQDNPEFWMSEKEYNEMRVE
jgi:hypothetical protein